MVETFLNGQCREFSARNAERKRTPCKGGGGSPIIPHDEPPAAVLFYTWYLVCTTTNIFTAMGRNSRIVSVGRDNANTCRLDGLFTGFNRFNPFRTAVPFSDRTQILSSLPPKRG